MFVAQHVVVVVAVVATTSHLLLMLMLMLLLLFCQQLTSDRRQTLPSNTHVAALQTSLSILSSRLQFGRPTLSDNFSASAQISTNGKPPKLSPPKATKCSPTNLANFQPIKHKRSTNKTPISIASEFAIHLRAALRKLMREHDPIWRATIWRHT